MLGKSKMGKKKQDGVAVYGGKVGFYLAVAGVLAR